MKILALYMMGITVYTGKLICCDIRETYSISVLIQHISMPHKLLIGVHLCSQNTDNLNAIQCINPGETFHLFIRKEEVYENDSQ
jgi:hypothetical protein